MMNNSIDENAKGVLEVREGWKGYYLFWCFVWFAIIPICLIIPSQRQDTWNFFFRNWNINKWPAFLVLFGIPAICLFYYFDKKVKIRIDALGIWTKKHGTIFWNTISTYRTTQVYQKEGDQYTIILQLKEPEHESEVRIEFRRMNKSIEEIREAISHYAIQYDIGDKGHKKGFF